jgi:hypothetical protein
MHLRLHKWLPAESKEGLEKNNVRLFHVRIKERTQDFWNTLKIAVYRPLQQE